MYKIITGFLGWVLSPITAVLNLLPGMPPELVDIVHQVLVYMRDGMGLINWFCPLALIAPALATWLAVEVCVYTYKIVLWSLRKIPFLGIR